MLGVVTTHPWVSKQARTVTRTMLGVARIVTRTMLGVVTTHPWVSKLARTVTRTMLGVVTTHPWVEALYVSFVQVQAQPCKQHSNPTHGMFTDCTTWSVY